MSQSTTKILSFQDAAKANVNLQLAKLQCVNTTLKCLIYYSTIGLKLSPREKKAETVKQNSS